MEVTRLLLITLILLLAACSTAEPESAAEMSGELTVSDVRANMTLPSDTGSIWLNIHNGTDKDDALIGADFEGCAAIELHDMVMEDDVMVMREVEGGKIPVPAGTTVELKRGGLHVMCIGKEKPLEVGSSLDIVLQFENGGAINVTAVVVEPGEMKMDMDGSGQSDMEDGEHSEMDSDS